MYGDVAGAAEARGRTPPCIEFNRRGAKVTQLANARLFCLGLEQSHLDAAKLRL